MNPLKRLVFFGQYSVFCSPRPPKCCTVPKKPISLEQKLQRCCTVPKKPKHNKVWRALVFWDSTAFLLVLAQKHWFFWDSTAFLQSQASKVLYCPKKTNRFKAKRAKMLYCPKKTKKNKVWRAWAPPGPGGRQTLVFWFLCDSTAFLLGLASKHLFLGTVQRFCSFGPKALVQ